MQATAEIQMVPIGVGVSVRNEVRRVVEILNNSSLIVETHASGTNVEGELRRILRVIEDLHEMLHAQGSIRLISFIKLETRTDKTPTLAGKRL